MCIQDYFGLVSQSVDMERSEILPETTLLRALLLAERVYLQPSLGES